MTNIGPKINLPPQIQQGPVLKACPSGCQIGTSGYGFNPFLWAINTSTEIGHGIQFQNEWFDNVGPGSVTSLAP